MQLFYSNPEETTITVTLDEGEVGLGDLVGPTVAHVPTDPLNRHYAAILDEGWEVYAYATPERPIVDDILGPRFRK
jgi:hypothetical protein